MAIIFTNLVPEDIDIDIHPSNSGHLLTISTEDDNSETGIILDFRDEQMQELADALFRAGFTYSE